MSERLWLESISLRMVNNMYDYVFFDLDGTISDSSEGITKGIQIALNHMGIEAGDRNELRRFIGPPLKYSFKNFYGFDDEQCEEGIRKYSEYYSVTGLFENIPYPGIKELLIKVKESGRKIVLATSKPEVFAKQILEKFEFAEYFDLIAGSSLNEGRGNKNEVIEYALESLGNPELSKVVLVGDTRFDAEGANLIGIDCIGVLYGFGSREELENEGVKMIAPAVEDIFAFL